MMMPAKQKNTSILQGSQSDLDRLAQAERVSLFLDYDGTLADFAPTPDHILPDSDLISLLTLVKEQPNLRVSIISGRRLSHIQALLPIPGLLLAGTYGIELQTPEGKIKQRLDFDTFRPTLEKIKPEWQGLIEGKTQFYLEDKGWSLALHARFADEDQANSILQLARKKAIEVMQPGIFRILGGHKFLEISPFLADKGQTISYLLTHCPWNEALPVYAGDDDKDEAAFRVIKEHSGIAILVSTQPRKTYASLRLESPSALRKWLQNLMI